MTEWILTVISILAFIGMVVCLGIAGYVAYKYWKDDE